MRGPALLVGLILPMSMLFVRQANSQSSVVWRDPSPHEVRWVTVEEAAQLEVLDWGGSGRLIVLLGCYLTAHVYDDFAPKLSNQFHTYGITRRHGVAFPEGELRQQFVANADGSVGSSRMSSAMRTALTEPTRVKPDYSRIRVPVLAIYRQTRRSRSSQPIT